MLREKLGNPLVSSFSYIMYNIYKRACIIFMETIKTIILSINLVEYLNEHYMSFCFKNLRLSVTEFQISVQHIMGYRMEINLQNTLGPGFIICSVKELSRDAHVSSAETL